MTLGEFFTSLGGDYEHADRGEYFSCKYYQEPIPFTGLAISKVGESAVDILRSQLLSFPVGSRVLLVLKASYVGADSFIGGLFQNILGGFLSGDAVSLLLHNLKNGSGRFSQFKSPEGLDDGWNVFWIKSTRSPILSFGVSDWIGNLGNSLMTILNPLAGLIEMADMNSFIGLIISNLVLSWYICVWEVDLSKPGTVGDIIHKIFFGGEGQANKDELNIPVVALSVGLVAAGVILFSGEDE